MVIRAGWSDLETSEISSPYDHSPIDSFSFLSSCTLDNILDTLWGKQRSMDSNYHWIYNLYYITINIMLLLIIYYLLITIITMKLKSLKEA